jgi:hypothetical protein
VSSTVYCSMFFEMGPLPVKSVYTDYRYRSLMSGGPIGVLPGLLFYVFFNGHNTARGTGTGSAWW